MNIAGVKVGEIAQGRARGRPRRRDDEDRSASTPPIYRDATMLLRPKTGLKDMVVELDPGTPTAGELPEGGTIPVARHAARRQPRRGPRRRSTPTRATTCSCSSAAAGEGLGGQGRGTLRRRCKRFEPTGRDVAADHRPARGPPQRTSAARSTTSGCSSRRSATRTSSSRARRLLRTRSSRASPTRTRNLRETLELLPGTLDRPRQALGKAETLARTLGPTLAGAAAGRPRARPGAARDAAVPARDRRRSSGTSCGRSPATARPSSGSCARRLATSPT